VDDRDRLFPEINKKTFTFHRSYTIAALARAPSDRESWPHSPARWLRYVAPRFPTRGGGTDAQQHHAPPPRHQRGRWVKGGCRMMKTRVSLPRQRHLSRTRAAAWNFWQGLLGTSTRRHNGARPTFRMDAHIDARTIPSCEHVSLAGTSVVFRPVNVGRVGDPAARRWRARR